MARLKCRLGDLRPRYEPGVPIQLAIWTRMTAVKTKTDLALTKRELEIARLIAHQMTSRDIATKLFISERTVEAHVTNMLNKLGLNSRIQVAQWLASVGGTEPITPDAR